MKNILLIICLYPIVAFAQDLNGPSFTYGDQVEFKSGSFHQMILSGSEENLLFSIKPNLKAGNKNTFALYNEDLKFIKELTIDIDKKYGSIQEVFFLKNSFYVFTVKAHNSSPSRVLYGHTLNQSLDGLINSTVLMELQDPTGNPLYDLPGEFRIIPDEDSGKLLIIGKHSYTNKKKNELSLAVFNQDFINEWSSVNSLDADARSLVFQDFMFHDGKSVYLTLRQDNDLSKKERKGKSKYEYLIFGIINEGTEIIQSVVKPDVNFIESISFYQYKNKLVCYGFGKEDFGSGINSCYRLEFEPVSLEVLSSVNSKIKDDVIIFFFENKKIKEKMKKKLAKGAPIGLRSAEYCGSVIGDNGQVLLQAEYVRTATTTSTSAGYTSSNSLTSYGNMIVFGISNQGEIISNNSIIKNGDHLFSFWNDRDFIVLYNSYSGLKYNTISEGGEMSSIQNGIDSDTFKLSGFDIANNTLVLLSKSTSAPKLLKLTY